MSSVYKGITLNDPGDPAPWSSQENTNFKEIIDSIALGTVEGSLAGAKSVGHRHYSLYSQATALLTLSIDSAQKTTMTGDAQIDGDVVISSLTTPGFIKNDGAGNITGGNSSIDDTDLNRIKAGLVTGWLTPAKIDVNAGDNTKFDIVTAGEAQFVDKSTYPFTVTNVIVPTQTGITANLGLSGREIHVFVDVNGTIIQKNPFDLDDLLTYCHFGNLTKDGAGTALAFEVNREPVYDSNVELFRQFIGIIGGIARIPINFSGVSSTLEVNRASGEVIRIGISASIDRVKPDNKTVLALSPVTQLARRYVDSSGNLGLRAGENVFDTTLNPTLFYNKNTSSFNSVTTSKFTAQRVYYFASSDDANETNMVLYGHVEWASIDDAKAAIGTAGESFVKSDSLRQAVFCGWWILKGNATDTSDPAVAEFVAYTSPFEITGASGGSVFNAGAAGNNQEIQFNTSGSLDADPNLRFNKAQHILEMINTVDNADIVFKTDAFKASALYGRGADAVEMGISGNTPVVQAVSSNDLVITNGGAGGVSVSGAVIDSTGDGSKVLSDNGTYVPLTGGGGSLSFSYRFSTTTTPPPSSGQLRYNNATQTSSTLLYVHETTTEGQTIHNLLTGMKVGDRLFLMNSTDSSQYQEWRIDSITDNTTYVTYGITLLSSEGASFTNNQAVNLIRSGASVDSILMQDTYNNSNQPQILTSDAKGSVQFKRGTTGGDTDKVFEVLNNSDFSGFAVEGHGNVRIGQGASDSDAVIYMKGSGTSKGGAIVAQNSAGSNGHFDVYTNATKRLRIDKDDGTFEIGTAPDKITLYPLTNDGIGPTPVPSQDIILNASEWQMSLQADNHSVMRLYTTATPPPADMELILGNGGTTSSDNGAIRLRAGQVFIENTTNGSIDLFSLSGGGATVFNQFRVGKSGTQTMNNGVEVTVNWETEDYDPDNIMNLTTDTATVGTAGIFTITASVKVSVSAGGQIETYLYINGTKVTTSSGSIDTAGTMVANVAFTTRLAINDTIQVKSAQFTGFAGTMQIVETVFSAYGLPE